MRTPPTVERDPIRWFLYKVHNTFGDAAVDFGRCRYSVHDTGRSVGFHQCSFKPKELIEGYGFCTRHAEEVRQGLMRYRAAKKGRRR